MPLFVLLAGTNDSDAGDAMRGFEMRGVVNPSKSRARHGKEAVGCEDVAQHLAVSRFKDVERHQRLRKKRRVGQSHDRRLRPEA